jgi:hypothetical protein
VTPGKLHCFLLRRKAKPWEVEPFRTLILFCHVSNINCDVLLLNWENHDLRLSLLLLSLSNLRSSLPHQYNAFNVLFSLKILDNITFQNDQMKKKIGDFKIGRSGLV